MKSTPGAIPTSEDSVSQAAESLRPQELSQECGHSCNYLGTDRRVLCALCEIEQLKQIIARTVKTRDEYRADYYRVHGDYMDFKYPISRPKTAKPLTREEIDTQISQHANAMIELTKIRMRNREPPHCPSCNCPVD